MDRLLSRPEVEQAIGLKCSQIYTLMRKGKFPEPIKVGERAVRWRESEITDPSGTIVKLQFANSAATANGL